MYVRVCSLGLVVEGSFGVLEECVIGADRIEGV